MKIPVQNAALCLFTAALTMSSMAKAESALNPASPPETLERRITPINALPADFGPNVLVFDPSMPMDGIQSTLNQIYQRQETSQFGSDRYAYLFKPGSYNLSVPMGFYMSAAGLGNSPDDVTIKGGVNSLAAWSQGNSTQNFWRGVENLAIIPTIYSSLQVWGVSQATYQRRVHVRGSLWLFDYLYYPGGVNWSSGGFISDSVVDTDIVSGSQQQFVTRNSELTYWQGGVWNMVFVGDNHAPIDQWSTSPYTVVEKTPVVREKPYLVIDENNNYSVMVPRLKTNSQGISWGGYPDAASKLPINQFYIAHADSDNADTINNALEQGFHLILTPGIYHLSSSLKVNRANTIILGLGFATLKPENGTAAITIADVDGVSVNGIIMDAGAQESKTLLLAGTSVTNIGHSANPISLSDLSCRVGGTAPGRVQSCFVINVNNLLLDNVWLWRADHGNGVGWNVNPAKNGLIVNGADITAYGLFVEHFQETQTIWNGNGGHVYFYQSELPYDVPSQDLWMNNGVKGFPSYKVSNNVTSHTAKGVAVYANFYNNVQLENAIETPISPGVKLNHLVTAWLGIAPGSSVNHIINGTGNAVFNNNAAMQARSPD